MEQATAQGGAEHTAIIDMHRMMLKDEMLVLEAQRLIREDRLNAEWAVKRAVRKIKNAFHEHADEYFKERRADVDYVGERIIKNLLGQAPDVEEPPPEGAIIVAHDLSPADTALLLHERKVAAFVTDTGAKTSHTAIVARALEVPAVVGVRAHRRRSRGAATGSRSTAAAASSSSTPPPGERVEYEAARERFLERGAGAAPDAAISPPARSDDVTVRLAGNIEFVEEVPSLVAHGGEGVGLYRTEFLFLGRARPAERGGALPGLPARPRGARAAAGHHPHLRPRRRQAAGRHADASGEPRARAARDPLLPATAARCSALQLRALLRASVHGNLRIMFPMISGVAELRAARRALAEVARGAAPRGCAGARRHPGRHHDRAAVRGARSRTGSRASATSSPSGRTTSSSTRSASTGRTRTSPTCTSRCTSRCCAC